ncbi:hypothetical protein BpHYR1_001462 [Brachionus plicatilis]|uniref:Uncharacterized protein n=1 Tax=Brachionus plicatilis TaxID=10195 RepID=A0A3M7SQD2_BRAPC|nr:hypothetical protein BpHYR1_001462 [Brachionus plicatilis]
MSQIIEWDELSSTSIIDRRANHGNDTEDNVDSPNFVSVLLTLLFFPYFAEYKRAAFLRYI